MQRLAFFIEGISINKSEESIIKKLFDCFADENSKETGLLEKSKTGIDELRGSFTGIDRNKLQEENVLSKIKSGSFYSSDSSESQIL